MSEARTERRPRAALRLPPFGRLRRRIGDLVTAYLFVLPAAAVLFTFQYLPAIDIFRISLTNRLLLRPRWGYVGLDNYERLLNDGRFWNSVWNTFLFVVGSVPLQIALALALAIALAGPLRRAGFFRTVFFLPVAASLVGVSVIWEWIYHPRLGVLNELLGMIGVQGPNWLASSTWAMPSIILLVVWTGTGYYMVIYLAGVLDISKEYYEAAVLDGASRWQQFVHVTWPLLTPVTYLVIVLQVINSFQVFTTVYVMTGGGPARATEVLVYYLYQRAFESLEFGYASAIAVVLFLFLAVLTVIIRVGYGRTVTYDR